MKKVMKLVTVPLLIGIGCAVATACYDPVYQDSIFPGSNCCTNNGCSCGDPQGTVQYQKCITSGNTCYICIWETGTCPCGTMILADRYQGGGACPVAGQAQYHCWQTS